VGLDALRDAEKRFAEASRLHQSGRLAEAERLYGEILHDHPKHADALHFLGILAHQTTRHELAVELIGRAIALNARVPAFHNNLGNALKADGKLDAAAAAYRCAVQHDANYVPAHFNLGVLLQTRLLFEDAAACYARVIACQPGHYAAHLNLGNVLQAQGKLDDAAASYRRALHHKADYAEAHGNLGNVLRAQGRTDDAVTCYREALRLQPRHAEASNNLGILLLEKGLVDEAVAACSAAVAIRPDYAEALGNLGTALKEQGRHGEAMACFERALALKPDYAEARLGLAIAVIPIFVTRTEDSAAVSDKFAGSLDALRAWDAGHPGRLQTAAGSHQPFYLAYRPGNVGGLLSRYGDLVADRSAPAGLRDAGHPGARRVGERIIVAIVSGHVRRHPVWDMILRGLVEHVDRGRFALRLYHTGAIRDDETARARSRVECFVEGPGSPEGWRRRIIADQPDVVFFPEVGMDPTACALAVRRLAPLQIAGWGHPVTTGLPTMDLFLSGDLMEGPGADAHYRERLIRLPGTGVCTVAPGATAPEWHGPSRATGVVRFALCHQPIKFDPSDDALLARIARAIGPSEFWLVSPRQHAWVSSKLHDRLAIAFRAEGLDPDAHLRVTPWLTHPQFEGFLDSMDIYLDCPAFSGYTTAWTAVHRGLPIVTLEGDFLRQRLASGLLRQIGLTEGIAATREHYVDIAIRWARESQRTDCWAARRASNRRAAAAADDNTAAVRAFEAVLTAAI
jgi:protein O-GlcNAc transferase